MDEVATHLKGISYAYLLPSFFILCLGCHSMVFGKRHLILNGGYMFLESITMMFYFYFFPVRNIILPNWNEIFKFNFQISPIYNGDVLQ